MQRSFSSPIFSQYRTAQATGPPPPNGKARAPPLEQCVPQTTPTPKHLQQMHLQVAWGLRVLSEPDTEFRYLTHEEAVRALSQNLAVITLLANMDEEERKSSFDNTKPTLIIVALVQLAVCLSRDDKDYIVTNDTAASMYNATAIRDRLLTAKMHRPQECKVYDDDGNLLWSIIPDIKGNACNLDGVRKLVDDVDGPKQGKKEAMLYKRAEYEQKLRQYSELLFRAMGVRLPRAILEGNKPCILEDGFEPSRRELCRREAVHRFEKGRAYKEECNERRRKGFFARFGYAMHRNPCARPGGSTEVLSLDLDGLVVMDNADVLTQRDDECNKEYDLRLAKAIEARTQKEQERRNPRKHAVAALQNEPYDKDFVKAEQLLKERYELDKRILARLKRVCRALEAQGGGEEADLEI